MNQTVTITTKSISEQLNKWHLTNHSPFQEIKVETSNNDIEVFDQPSFETILEKVSRKISEPVAETK
jgi:hypothetical protein